MPNDIRSKMIYGFKVSQGLRRKNKSRDNGHVSNSYEGVLKKSSLQMGSIGVANQKDLRYSLKQYEELVNHMWR